MVATYGLCYGLCVAVVLLAALALYLVARVLALETEAEDLRRVVVHQNREMRVLADQFERAVGPR